MAEAELDQPIMPHVEIPTRSRSPWVRGMACVAMLPLLAFIGQSGRTLWGDWESLRVARVAERNSAIVGYVNINPRPNYAGRPNNWLHDEGDATLLWAGWKNDTNHWFRVGLGEIDPDRISLPMGRDVLQAIDLPIYDKAGDARWEKLPYEALVATFQEKGQWVAYPLRVLDKVEVVNDEFGGRPVLVTLTPKIDAVTVYAATLNGRRVLMGHSGYFFGHVPIFYDRETESLWSDQEGVMVAFAGKRKGAALKQIARLKNVYWGDWKAENAIGKLLIGADRSQESLVK